MIIVCVLFAGGCTGVISSTVETQPRVNLQKQDYIKPEKIVNGKPVFYVPDIGHQIKDKHLQKYAPFIIQGFQPDKNDTDYSYWSDGIGYPVLE